MSGAARTWQAVAVLALALLLLAAAAPRALAQTRGSPPAWDWGPLLELRRQLRQEEALAQLSPEQKQALDPALLATLALEASLIQKLGPAEERRHLQPEQAVRRLSSLELLADEELVLAELCYFLGFVAAAEDSIGRARDKDPQFKARTDEILSRYRGEILPQGGYYRYRGRFLPMVERDRDQALDDALEGLQAARLEKLDWRFVPSRTEGNREAFAAAYGDKGPDFLRQAARLLREQLAEITREVRGWIPSYANFPLREGLLRSLADIARVRKEALDLIARYEKADQPLVDDYRRKLEGLSADHDRLVARELKALRSFPVAEGHSLWQRCAMREAVLASIDQYLELCFHPDLEPATIEPKSGADTTPRHLLPGREQSGLEDVLWLTLNFAAGRTLDVLQRSQELLLQENALTPWERWLAHELRCDALGRYNAQVATSLDQEERAFSAILTGYRKMLGLAPLEIEERCVVSARKHSQEMIDLGYFGHISPVPRNRTPTDRARLEGYGGGVGENCLASSGPVDARGAFEGWYHSPGHHRLLVSGGPQMGVGAASEHRMWTLVVGGTDASWRLLHKDLTPERRTLLAALTLRARDQARSSSFSEELKAALSAELPEILPFIAREAFEAVQSPSAMIQVRAPALLDFLISAEVRVEWRPLQVAAVAAAIDFLDHAEASQVRAAVMEMIRPLVAGDHRAGDHGAGDQLGGDQGYDPAASRKARQPAVLAIRRTWEDTAQWRYRCTGPVALPSPGVPPGRVGDGPSLRSPLKVLTPKERLRLATRRGGGPHTEQAIERGLEWLAKVQNEDGAWRARSFATRLPAQNIAVGQLGTGTAEWEIAMTGLALLAFVNAGNTTHQGDHAETVERGARFLMSHVVDYGMFETTAGHYMYSHAIATQALCELYAYTADPYIGLLAQLGVDYLIHAQDPMTGGWRYQAKEAGDMSVTGWVILALNSARKAQLDLAGIRDALRFIDDRTYPAYYQVGYTSTQDGGTPRLGAVGSLARLFLTADKKDLRVLFNAQRFLKNLPKRGQEDFYYWYYATLVMFQLEGEYWKAWNEALFPVLLSNQVSDQASPLYGSFAPVGPYSEHGGRLYQTALGLLMMMTYYRYDRELTPAVGPWTGNLMKEIEPYLTTLETSADPVLRDVAERKMLDRFGSSLVPHLVQELQKSGKKREYRETLASLLSRCASPQDESLILALLSAEGEATVKKLLVQALENACTTKSVAVLLSYLNDGDHLVRGTCAEALGRIGDRSASVALSERLAIEGDGWCRAKIEEALRRLVHREALAALLDDALAPTDARLRIEAGLRMLENTGLARRLVELKAREPRVYERIKAAVREHGEMGAIPLALAGLESADLETRTESIKVLRMLTQQDRGFNPEAPEEERKRAVESWRTWWQSEIADLTRPVR
ncbi:MAG: HEAT repeat domain-containing protein [Planctomycetota bacterium]